MAEKKKNDNAGGTIAVNKRASHEYFIEQRIEAGIELQGWEVKALRAGRASIVDGYILLKNHEVFLFGATITPLSHDKRDTIKDREWQRDKARVMKKNLRGK